MSAEELLADDAIQLDLARQVLQKSQDEARQQFQKYVAIHQKQLYDDSTNMSMYSPQLISQATKASG